jgi:drug/metabolite transporter (DMT)-like permease
MVEYIGMVLGFMGVVGIILSKNHDNFTTYDPSTRLTGLLISFTLAWVFSATCVFNRRLRNVNFAVVLFYHSIFGFTMSLLYIFIEWLVTDTGLRLLTYTWR